MTRKGGALPPSSDENNHANRSLGTQREVTGGELKELNASKR